MARGDVIGSAEAGLPPRHPPGTCTNRLPGRFCHTELTDVLHHELAPHDPRLHTQCWIDQRLRHLSNDEPVAEYTDDLADLDAMGAWIRYRARPRDFDSYGDATRTAFRDYLARRHRRVRQPSPTT